MRGEGQQCRKLHTVVVFAFFYRRLHYRQGGSRISERGLEFTVTGHYQNGVYLHTGMQLFLFIKFLGPLKGGGGGIPNDRTTRPHHPIVYHFINHTSRPIANSPLPPPHNTSHTHTATEDSITCMHRSKH